MGRALTLLLKHPTLPVALLGVVTTVAAAVAPPISDVMFAREKNVPIETVDVTRTMTRFFSVPENLSCPVTFTDNRASVEVDPLVLPDNTELYAIQCHTGDIAITVVNTDQTGRKSQTIIPVLRDDVMRHVRALRNITVPAGRDEARSAWAPPGLAAHAAPTPFRMATPADEAPAAGMRLAQGAQVLATWQVDARTIARKVRADNQCFEEYIDTLSGRVVRVVPVVC